MERSHPQSWHHKPGSIARGVFSVCAARPEPRADRTHLVPVAVLTFEASPRVMAVNLDTLIGRKDIWTQRGAWLGAEGLLAHWVRTYDAYERVTADFEKRNRHREVVSDVACHPWAAEFARLAEFPCCHNWSVCAPVAPLLAFDSYSRPAKIKREHG